MNPTPAIELKVDDPVLGERTIAASTPEEFAKLLVFDQWSALTKVHHAGKGNADIEWEIRLYEFILQSPEAGFMAERYLRTRFDANFGPTPIPKRKVASILGWNVS
jgi:hypothetical protein